MTDITTKPEILVIGAGAAGIAAATKLIGNGLENIKILEAENRIGGRIYSTNFDGVQVDLGAQWCHGEKGNIVYEKVKDLDLLGQTSSADYSTFNFYTSDGIEIDKDISDCLIALCEESSHETDYKNDHNGTFKEYFLKSFERHSKDLFSTDKELDRISKMVLDFYHKLVLCYEAAENWDDCAAKAVFTKCEGQWLLHWKNKGFSTIIDIIMSEMPESKQNLLKKNIFLEKTVNKIIWEDNQKVKIECTDGSSFKADHVIVTVSVGVLKNFVRNHTFMPKLLSDKVSQIQAIPLGTTDKILLKFPTKWWPDSITDFSLLWREEDKKRLPEEFPYGPTKDGRSWLEDIFGFYTIDNHPNILLGWVVGPMAKEIELISDEIVTKGCMFLLKKFLGNKFKIPKPDNVLRSKWGTNPHFCGSYSYNSVEMVSKNIQHEHLAEPLWNSQQMPVVLFAGEATHSHYMSTVHGAIDTGYREADRLINLYKK